MVASLPAPLVGVVVVAPVAEEPSAAAASPLPICHPLKKILATLDAGLVTVNVVTVVDCRMPAKRAAVGVAVQEPGNGAPVG